jgi:preprotein translocase subunit SecG
MMTLLTGFLTVVLMLDCLFLILLILIQLPKKEAGAGVAFGGAATDALFGAGSGTALTKITKYCSGLFLGLALFLSILNAHRGGSNSVADRLRQKASVATPVVPILTSTNMTATNAAAPAQTPLLSTTNSTAATNPPAPKE